MVILLNRQGAKEFVNIVSNRRAGRISAGMNSSPVQRMRLPNSLIDTSMNSSWRLGALAAGEGFPLYHGGSKVHV
jgi:hypothetical protein